MSRGILYLVWKGECDPSNVLQRSIASVKHWHPELPYHVAEMPAGSSLLCKSKMFELSPFDETLFLDADTTVLGKLDYGFAKARQHGIACCINANPWQRRYYKIEQHPDEVEYSSGVVFFDKNWRSCEGGGCPLRSTKLVFNAWDALDGIDTTCSYFHAADGLKQQPFNDQALFTLAMQQAGFNPFVLPLNWNLYPKWQQVFWGEVKVWHGYDDIPDVLMRWNAEQSKPDAVIRCGQLPLKTFPKPAASEPYAFDMAYARVFAMPEVAMDKRHVFMLHDVLKAWPFKSALEIGSFNGASSTAFVEAINSGEGLGESGEATFCDVSVTDSLIDVVQNCRDLARVRVTPQPSWQVLDSELPFDFVLVDAAHDMDSVTLEVKRLMDRRPVCVMAHDTSATDAGYSKCEGAAMLKRSFMGARGYRSIEDNVKRDGERTDRGLFLATTDMELYRRASNVFAKWA